MYILDLIGTFAFAIGGAYKAKFKKLNIFGSVFLGTITAVGGGSIRDLVINRTPVFYLIDQNYLLICLFAGLVTYFLPNFFSKTYSIFRFFDSLGLAAFVVIGVSVPMHHLFPEIQSPTVLSGVVCIFLGMLTGCGGGILRDSILGDTPYSFKKGSGYISSAFWGASVYYALMHYNHQAAVPVSMAVTLVLREMVSKFGMVRKLFLSRK